jgi:NADPH-dependent curcumin reductase CurA
MDTLQDAQIAHLAGTSLIAADALATIGMPGIPGYVALLPIGRNDIVLIHNNQ